ncbi:response regulator [Nakamurella sp. YIM 132087]|uniref:Response regulator n=1 Tax=Nakamurella alba TaxID=2665158 RepID=A0A7K1FM13_9ACTN|nr:response regulator [Nakamurella alba]
MLLVEDDETLRTVVADALRDAGYLVAAVGDGDAALDLAAQHRPDLAVLDVMLPGRSGFQLAAALHEGSDLPVVFVTARDAVDDRLTGFDLGADDYLVKPFEIAELLARLRAVLRRTGRLSSPVVQVADLVIDEDSGIVLRDGRPLDLTATELRLLSYLARHRGRVLSKTQILTQVWGYDAYDPNLVEAFVSALRRKTELHGERLIHTVRGIGYRLSAPLAEAS